MRPNRFGFDSTGSSAIAKQSELGLFRTGSMLRRRLARGNSERSRNTGRKNGGAPGEKRRGRGKSKRSSRLQGRQQRLCAKG